MAPEPNLLTIDKYLIQAHFKNSLLLGIYQTKSIIQVISDSICLILAFHQFIYHPKTHPTADLLTWR